jgi:purine-binding chemotaxis protein CheW
MTIEVTSMTDKVGIGESAVEGTIQVVSFKVGETCYGIDIRLVREIRAWSATTKLPNTPQFVRGVIYLRGAIVPILDLRAYFGQGTTEPGTAHVVIVVAVGRRIVGILVDSVLDIVTIPKSKIKPGPTVEDSMASDSLDGLAALNQQIIALIAVQRVVSAASVP